MATQKQPTTASTETVHAGPFIEPPGSLPEIISNARVTVEKRTGPRLTAEQHRELVQVTAYHLAERRGFEPGHESEDWATAEMMVIDKSGLPVT
jgi:hypothetical protein